MAAVAEISGEVAAANSMLKPKSKMESDFNVQKLVDMFTKLNPLAKEFFPSSYSKDQNLDGNHQFFAEDSMYPNDKLSVNDYQPNNRRVLISLF